MCRSRSRVGCAAPRSPIREATGSGRRGAHHLSQARCMRPLAHHPLREERGDGDLAARGAAPVRAMAAAYREERSLGSERQGGGAL